MTEHCLEILEMKQEENDAANSGDKGPGKVRSSLGMKLLAAVLASGLGIFFGGKIAMTEPLQVRNQTAGRLVAAKDGGGSQTDVKGRDDDIVVTDRDIAKAYKEVVKEREEREQTVKTLRAEKGSFYRVSLAGGRSLLAVEIQSTGDTVRIIDDKGMEIGVAKQEIAGIEKVKD